MPVRAVALMGPGLDGQLAIALLQRQGIDVIAATLSSAFSNALPEIQRAAERLGVPLHFLAADETYYERVRHPRHGYARELAPCLDCKIYMLRAASELRSQLAADLVVTGDVVGQRLPGQSKRELAMVDLHAGLEGQVLRPLSAQLLPATKYESTGQINRHNLLAMQGRGRQAQLKLAGELRLEEIPAVTSGCLLADASYARKLNDLLVQESNAAERDFALLRWGRHYRLGDNKIVIGRNASENQALEAWLLAHPEVPAEIMSPSNFVGPSALMFGMGDDSLHRSTAHLIWQLRKKGVPMLEFCTFTIADCATMRHWQIAEGDLVAPLETAPRPI